MSAVVRGRPSPIATLDGGLTRKSIITNPAIVTCDVCGRTLLRGEHHDVFLAGGSRRNVCELCTGRAVHEGWIREGLDDVVARSRDARARSRGGLLSRLRHRRNDGPVHPPAPAPPRPRYGAEPAALSADAYLADEDDRYYEPDPRADAAAADVPAQPSEAAPPDAPAAAPPQQPEAEHLPDLPRAAPEPPRHQEPADHTLYESRSVHGVPTNAELKIARALELFNASSHVRTVYGVGRSLGAPIVSARPSRTEGSVVTIVVAWELSWYRFEVDLANEPAGVRVAAQGSELDELEQIDQTPNAAAGDDGRLHSAASLA
jgi:hypothetical protein